MMFEGFSQKEKLIMLLLLSLLLCSWLGLFPGTCSASGTYQITEAELTELQDNLSRLQLINDSLTQALGEQRNKAVDLQTALTEAQEQLTEARRRQTALQVELANLKDLSKMQAESLEKANKSFEMFAKEEKARRVRIKAQRNAWEAVSACALIAFVAK